MRLELSVLDGNRACRGRRALGGGNGSRDGVDGRVRTGVAARSGMTVGGGLEKSGESARGGLRGRRTLDDDRGVATPLETALVLPVLPFVYEGDASEYPFTARRGVEGGKGTPLVGVGARSILWNARGGGLAGVEECSDG